MNDAAIAAHLLAVIGFMGLFVFLGLLAWTFIRGVMTVLWGTVTSPTVTSPFKEFVNQWNALEKKLGVYREPYGKRNS